MTKGLRTRVLPDAEVAGDVLRVARRLAVGAPLAARINKKTAARLCPAPEPLSESELNPFFSHAPSRAHPVRINAFIDGQAPGFSEDCFGNQRSSVRIACSGYQERPTE